MRRLRRGSRPRSGHRAPPRALVRSRGRARRPPLRSSVPNRRARSARTCGRLLREQAPRRCPRPTTRTSEASGSKEDCDRAVGGRVAKRVRQQVVEHAFDLDPARSELGHRRSSSRLHPAPASPEPRPGARGRRTTTSPDTSASRSSSVKAPASIRASSNRSSTRWRENAHLFLHGLADSGRALRFRLRRPRASPGEKRWACAGHDLPRRRARGARRRVGTGCAAISLKERASSASSAGPLSGARAVQVTAGESCGGIPQAVDADGDRPGDEQRGDHGRRGRGGRDGQDLHVVAHVEHDPAREQDDCEGENDCEKGEAGELKPNTRQTA